MRGRLASTGVALFCLASAAMVVESAQIWLDVPFVRQPREGCGAAAISMVMQYWGQKENRDFSASADVAKIQSALYSPQEHGIPASEMKSYFERQRFQAFTFAGTWDDLKHHIEKGRPLIVCLQRNGVRGPLHYVVVAGIDVDRGYVFVNDPADRKLLRISREGFLAEWAANGDWTLLALPWRRD